MLLDDPPAARSNNSNPRPPTMIERRLASHNVAPSISGFPPTADFAEPQLYNHHGQAQQRGLEAYGSYAAQQTAAAAATTGGGAAAYDQGYGSQGHNGYAPNAQGHYGYTAEPQAHQVHTAYAAEAYDAEAYSSYVVEHPQAHQHTQSATDTHDAYGGM